MVKEGHGAFPVPKANDIPLPANIKKIGALKRFSDEAYAKSLLYDAARLVAPIIHEQKFKVGKLYEMYPDKAELWGLNVNHGQKIYLRLREHHNDKLFLPMGDIVGTLLHELTHNLYSAHDSKFYKFLDKLKSRYDDIHCRGAKTKYLCEENKVGRGVLLSGSLVSVREQRLKELSKPKFANESKVLGLNSKINKPIGGSPRDLRQAILEAAERRLRDSKWCHSENAETESVPKEDEYDTTQVELIGPTEGKPVGTFANDIIDLTSDTEETPIQPDNPKRRILHEIINFRYRRHRANNTRGNMYRLS